MGGIHYEFKERTTTLKSMSGSLRMRYSRWTNRSQKHLVFFKIALKHFDPKSRDITVPFYEFKPLFPNRGMELEFFLRFMSFIDDCFSEKFKKYPNTIGGSKLVVLKGYRFEGGNLIFQFKERVHKLLSSPEI